jgi:hypothetical protein
VEKIFRVKGGWEAALGLASLKESLSGDDKAGTTATEQLRVRSQAGERANVKSKRQNKLGGVRRHNQKKVV